MKATYSVLRVSVWFLVVLGLWLMQESPRCTARAGQFQQKVKKKGIEGPKVKKIEVQKEKLEQEKEDDDQVYLEEMRSKESLKQAAAAEKEEQWESALAFYLQAAERCPNEVYRLGAKAIQELYGRSADDAKKMAERGFYVSVANYTLYKISRMPVEVIKSGYRLNEGTDGKARRAFEKALKEDNLVLLEQAIRQYFFASGADEMMNYVASRYFEEGRLKEALFHWERLLTYYPDPQVSLSAVAAKMAVGCRLLHNKSGLLRLQGLVRTIRQEEAKARQEGHHVYRSLPDAVMVGGQQVALDKLLEGALAAVDKAAESALPPEGMKSLGGEFANNEIRRWTTESPLFEEVKVNANAYDPWGRRGMMMGPRGQGTNEGALLEVNNIPTTARVPDPKTGKVKEYILCTNGKQVWAVSAHARKVDPKTHEGVVWTWPDKINSSRGGNNGGFVMQKISPLCNCAYDEQNVYLPFYSTQSTNSGGGMGMGWQQRVGFYGASVLAAIDIRRGSLQGVGRWNRDYAAEAEKRSKELDRLKQEYQKAKEADLEALNQQYQQKEKDFKERYDFIAGKPFSFCSAPIVVGERLYIGVVTAGGECESYVLCIDKKSGEILWKTFLCSVMQAGGQFGVYGAVEIPLTLLTESDGVLYCQTSMGVVGAVHSQTGDILWLTRYKRMMQKSQNYYQPAGLVRPPNFPLLYKNQILYLPQDTKSLLIVDKDTGEVVGDPDVAGSDYMAGVMCAVPESKEERSGSDTLILTGRGSGGGTKREGSIQTLSLPSFKRVTPGMHVTEKQGRPVLYKGVVYIPTSAGLKVFNLFRQKGMKEFSVVSGGSWKSAQKEAGNIVIIGGEENNLFVLSNTNLACYTDQKTFEREWQTKFQKEPSNPDLLFQYAGILADNVKDKVLDERVGKAAITYYRRFIESVKENPEYREGKKKNMYRQAMQFIEAGRSPDGTSEKQPEEPPKKVPPKKLFKKN